MLAHNNYTITKQGMRLLLALFFLAIPLWSWAGFEKLFNGATDDVPLEKVDFFNTNHLKDKALIQKKLLSLGCKKVTFTSEDGHINQGLFLERPNAQATAIIIGGISTKKEHLASFLYMFPENYNILFLDARYDNKKPFYFLKNLPSYGVREYQDIITAIQYIHEQTHKPIIIHGCCAGAFHAGRALVSLQESNQLEQYNVKGLIFDSGWGSLTHIADRAPFQTIHKYLYVTMIKIGMAKEKIQQTRIFKILNGFFSTIVTTIKANFLNHGFKKADKKINLFKKINIVPIPIFYIHSADDKVTSISQAKKLSKLSKHPYCWWIPARKSKHARHHLKFPEEYASHIHHFCSQALNNTFNSDQKTA
jgi:hypothetical protein